MMLKIYNTLTRKIEPFKPINPPHVGIYSCGPTVYWNQHIGHMYAYVVWDVLIRTLRYLGYKVNWVMNITDVGHMTSEGDSGEDKMEKGARREDLTVWQIADIYIKQFIDSLDLLNISKPKLVRATEHIQEQIDLIKKIEARGFTYKTKMGLVFDTEKFPGYAGFGKLDLNKQKKGERAEFDPEKKRPEDFFLWVTGQPDHIMQWDSPWGRGFPGWHIECTAMSTFYLGENFDIHTGGIEHIPVHHTNEIAQGYAAFGRSTANFWLHNAHLLGRGGVKMSKSLGNFITVQELVEKKYNPLALRYFILNSQYQTGASFSWEALAASAAALNKLNKAVIDLKEKAGPAVININYDQEFKRALEANLNTPKALAVSWNLLKDKEVSDAEKLAGILKFDEVFGLDLSKTETVSEVVPLKIRELLKAREEFRKTQKWQEADKLRKKIERLGYTVEDTPQGARLKSI